jgi:hypothetical protein
MFPIRPQPPAPPPSTGCPHCDAELPRVKFNRRFFHEIGEDTFQCTRDEPKAPLL